MDDDARRALTAIRFGFGLSPRHPPADAGAMLASLAAPDAQRAAHPLPGQAEGMAETLRVRDLRRAANEGVDGAAGDLAAAEDAARAWPRETLRAAIRRAMDDPAPFRERLVLFWVDHFTQFVGTMPALLPAYWDDTIRPHVAGRFADLLKAVIRSPLMLTYLDQSASIGPGSRIGRLQGRGLNENLARELLELHTLGVAGRYGQGDVRQLAELLTGLRMGRTSTGFEFRADAAEPGAETVLGTRYGGAGAQEVAAIDAALEDLAAHPDTARHVSRRIAAHFVADAPDPDLVAAMAEAWRRSGGRLAFVYAAMLDHPAAFAPPGPGGKAKPPVVFVTSALRALGRTGPELAGWREREWRRLVEAPMRAMGQHFVRPRAPDGWPEAAAAWIGPQGLASRIRWSMNSPSWIARDALPDPRAFVDTALGPWAGPRLRWAVGAAEDVPQGVALVLSSPEFNRS